jgi:hypothetical protein
MEEAGPWIMILLGVLTAGYVVYLYLKDVRLDSWPKAQGKVLDALVLVEHDWTGTPKVGERRCTNPMCSTSTR